MMIIHSCTAPLGHGLPKSAEGKGKAKASTAEDRSEGKADEAEDRSEGKAADGSAKIPSSHLESSGMSSLAS